MNTKELSCELRSMARAQKTPLCDKWFSAWEDNTPIDTLLDMYVRGFDFCIDNDYPSLDFIRKNFNKEDLNRHNIYIDQEVDIEGASGFYIFLGKCRCSVRFWGSVAATVYVRHESRIKLDARWGAVVFASVYDGSACATKADRLSRVHERVH